MKNLTFETLKVCLNDFAFDLLKSNKLECLGWDEFKKTILEKIKELFVYSEDLELDEETFGANTELFLKLLDQSLNSSEFDENGKGNSSMMAIVKTVTDNWSCIDHLMSKNANI